jgi:hypothetical protein
MNFQKYCIYFHGNNHKHGGVRALHVLRDELLNRGLDAAMIYEKRYSDAIVIYPEITPGNPLHAEKTVHWLLNKASIRGDGLIYAWESGMGDYPLLTVNIIEENLWLPKVVKRGGVAYWIGKGKKDPSIIPNDAIEISRSNFHKREELADFISNLDYLISFDPFTAAVAESIVAGIPVLIHSTDNQWSRSDIEKHNWYPYGVAWNLDEMDHARKTVGLARDHYYSLLPVFQKRIDNFVEVTQCL